MSKKLTALMMSPGTVDSGRACCTRCTMLAEMAAQASRMRRTPIEPHASRSLFAAVLAPLSRHITRNTAATSMIESKPKSIRLICRSLAANVSERAPSSVQWMALMISTAHAQRIQRFCTGWATPAQGVDFKNDDWSSRDCQHRLGNI